MDPETPSLVCTCAPPIHLWAGHIHRRQGLHRVPTPGFEMFTSSLDQPWMVHAFDLPSSSPCEVIHWKEGSVRQALIHAGHSPPVALLLALQKSAWSQRVSKLNVLVLVTGLEHPPSHLLRKAQDWVVFYVGAFTPATTSLAQASD